MFPPPNPDEKRRLPDEDDDKEEPRRSGEDGIDDVSPFMLPDNVDISSRLVVSEGRGAEPSSAKVRA